jgi:hypothetical protein
LPPVSLVLATRAQSYINGLAQYRFVGSPDSPAALDGVNTWIGRFAGACTRAVADASLFEQRANALEEEWRQRVGRIRANSGTELLLKGLPGAPVITVDGAAALIGRTFKSASEAIGRLTEVGILRQVTVGRRNRAFEAPDIVAAFTALERQLANPEGDPRPNQPSR